MKDKDLIHELQENIKIKNKDFKEAVERIDAHLRRIQNLEFENMKLQEDKQFWKRKNDEKIEVIQRLENQIDKLINHFIN